MSARVVHFELPVSDPETSIEFYTKVFDWKIEPMGGPMEYWNVITGPEDEPGINGGLMRRNNPEQPIAVAINVDNMDAYIEKIEAAGGEIVVPKMPIPGVGWLAYFKDPDGLITALWQGE